MSATTRSSSSTGMTLRIAAVVAGLAYLLSPVTYAEFTLMPSLVKDGDIAATVQNLTAHSGTFIAAFFCYLICFLEDIVLAWSLYYLLRPVNRAVSMLAAWFRLMYTALALVAAFNLLTVHQLIHDASYLKLFGSAPLQAQVQLLLDTFRNDWGMGLAIFGIHLVLMGCLIFRTGYMPRILGLLVVLNGLAWMIDSVRPYLFPQLPRGPLFVAFFGELVLMLWLLIRGWSIKEPQAAEPA